jgi:hypothetical protein
MIYQRYQYVVRPFCQMLGILESPELAPFDPPSPALGKREGIALLQGAQQIQGHLWRLRRSQGRGG